MSGRAPSSLRLEAECPDPGAHLEFAAAHFADPSVAAWHWPMPLGGPRSRAQVRSILEAQASQCERENFCFWWWRERAGDGLVGMVGLNRDRVEDEPVVEIGWSISPRSQRRGYATEAARASLAWGFEVIGLDRIVSFTMPHNRASVRVMEKLGLEPVREFERKGIPHLLYEARAGRTADASD